MKKLMITAAAAMTAMVGFCTIESSNVVGYDTVGLLQDGAAKGVGATFLKVDGSKMTLKDIKVVGYDATEGYADFEIIAQKLDGAGRTVDNLSYYWCDFEEEGETYIGWYDSDMNDYNSVTIDAGEGLWIYSPDSTFSIQTSGTVSDADIAVTLLADGAAKMVVNPMPVTLTLADIKVDGYDPENGYADFEIIAQKLDGAGRTLDNLSYYWCDFEEEGETFYGWYDSDMNDYNAVSLDAGEGLWIYSPSTDYSVVFPTPLK